MPFVNVHKKFMETEQLITIEIAYALPNEQVILSLDVDEGCLVEDAIKRSGILERYPQIDLSTDKVGIFGKMCKLNAKLNHKDRIEIYRKLIADPKESRRQQAEMQKKKQAKEKAEKSA